MRGTTVTTAALALGAMTLLGACGNKDNAATDTTATATTTSATMAGTTDSANANANATGNATGAAATTGANAQMSDAAIFAMLHASNQGEIDAGKMASTKGTNAQVRAFGHDMVTDHGRLQSEGDALARKLNITPDTAAADSIMQHNKMVASMLQSAPKGMAFDTAYVNGQVMDHQNTLEMVKRAEGAAQNPQLKSALQGAEPVIQRHLDRIKDTQGKMK